MAPALVGALGTISEGAANTLNEPAYNQTPTANNLLVLFLGLGNTTAATTPGGWTIMRSTAAETGARSTVYYKVAAGSDARPQIAAIASTPTACMLAEFSGVVSESPLDKVCTAGAIGTTTPISVENSAVDSKVGQLVIAASCAKYGSNATKALSSSLATVSATNEKNNNSVAIATHVTFAWGIQTSNASKDSNSFVFINADTGAVTVIGSFKASPGGILMLLRGG